jgi:hypothetical protein
MDVSYDRLCDNDDDDDDNDDVIYARYHKD